MEYSAFTMVSRMIPALSNTYDTTFLHEYLFVLQMQTADGVRRITSRIMVELEYDLDQPNPAQFLQAPPVVLSAFLCGGLLWQSPKLPGQRARACLLKLLSFSTEIERIQLVDACMRIAPAADLLYIYDVVRIEWDKPGLSLSDLIMRGILYALYPWELTVQWHKGFPSVQEVKSAIAAVTEDIALFAFVGRVLAELPPDVRLDILKFLEAMELRRPPNNERKMEMLSLRLVYGRRQSAHQGHASTSHQ